MSYEHNVGPPSRGDLVRAGKKGRIRRFLNRWMGGIGTGFPFIRSGGVGLRLPIGEERRAELVKSLGLAPHEERESPSGLAEADLTEEQEREAQEEFGRKYPSP